MNFDEVMDRVASIVEKDIDAKPYDKAIAKALDMLPSQYSNMKKKNNIPFEKILAYCAKKRISSSWVFYEQSSRMLDDNTEEVFKLKFLTETNGSAGGGAFNEEDEDIRYLSVDRVYMDQLGIKEGANVEAIKVMGDSMEPQLKDGAIVLIDRDSTDLSRNGIYVVNTINSGLLIKRVARNADGDIDLISDNKDYPIISFPVDDISIVGKVIGALEKM